MIYRSTFDTFFTRRFKFCHCEIQNKNRHVLWAFCYELSEVHLCCKNDVINVSFLNETIFWIFWIDNCIDCEDCSCSQFSQRLQLQLIRRRWTRRTHNERCAGDPWGPKGQKTIQGRPSLKLSTSTSDKKKTTMKVNSAMISSPIYRGHSLFYVFKIICPDSKQVDTMMPFKNFLL